MIIKSSFLFWLLIINSLNLFSQELLIIDIESEFNKKDFSTDLSNYIEEILYIPLETNVDILINTNPSFTVTKKEIVATTTSDCFMFERKTGKFLKRIGKKGKGPEEYRSTKGFVNPEDQTILFQGWGSKLLKFHFDGTFLKSVTIPSYNDSFTSPSLPTNYTWLNNNIVLYFGNLTGTEKKRIMVINENGKIIAIQPNYNCFKEEKEMALSLNESQFYHFKQRLYFKEDYSDTVFMVSEDTLIPKMILKLGKYQPSIKSKWMTTKELQNLKYKPIHLRRFIDSNSFFLFQFYFQEKYFQAIYNKNTNKLNIIEENDKLINNGHIPFFPASISSDGFIIGFVEAYKIKQWFNENPELPAKLPENLQKFKNIKETDNPIVIIAKLKE